ncbi:hypothetical protein VIGAN_UM059100, partial [Vigna angularis var. angularis]
PHSSRSDQYPHPDTTSRIHLQPILTLQYLTANTRNLNKPLPFHSQLHCLQPFIHYFQLHTPSPTPIIFIPSLPHHSRPTPPYSLQNFLFIPNFNFIFQLSKTPNHQTLTSYHDSSFTFANNHKESNNSKRRRKESKNWNTKEYIEGNRRRYRRRHCQHCFWRGRHH